MHRLMKRGLVASVALATVTTSVALLTAQAGAQPTRGVEAVNVTVYEVGTPPSSPAISVGGRSRHPRWRGDRQGHQR